MDIFNKHYEKLILVICLLVMMFGLWRVSLAINEAKDARQKSVAQGKINETAGDMAADFDPKQFVSSEQWIQRIKDGKPQDVLSINSSDQDDNIAQLWDRRYFSSLTRHSRKPIEEAEAKYRLAKNGKTVASLNDSIAKLQDAIAKRIRDNGDNEDDTRLAELRLQLEGFQILLANTEMDIEELNKRLSYITRFCTAQGSLVDPQEVICCPNRDCGALLLSNQPKCPFCGAEMPIVNPAEMDGLDTDGDGLPDAFEIEHARKRGFLRPGATAANPDAQMGMGGPNAMGMAGQQSQDGVLSHTNPADANQDFDGDSFTNLEEYRFGTDIDDETSFPNPANFVRLVDFDQDKVPFKFMGINDGRAPKEQKATKWRARFAFLRKFRGREYWETNEDRWEQVRINGKFEAPDGKTYIVNDIDVEPDGEKRPFVKVTEFVAPARGRRNAAPQQDAKPAEPPASYTLFANVEAFKEQWYAQLVYLVSRSSSMLLNCFNNYYTIQNGARMQRIQTRFRLVEGERLTLTVPITKKPRDNAANGQADNGQRRIPLQRFGRDNGMNMNGNPNAMAPDGNGMMSSAVEVELKSFDFIVAKFDREAKTLELVPAPDDKEQTAASQAKAAKPAADKADEADKAKPFVVTLFSEYEKFTLPDGRKFPLFYEGGGNMGMGGGEGMMMDAPGPGMNMPGRRMP